MHSLNMDTIDISQIMYMQLHHDSITTLSQLSLSLWPWNKFSKICIPNLIFWALWTVLSYTCKMLLIKSLVNGENFINGLNRSFVIMHKVEERDEILCANLKLLHFCAGQVTFINALTNRIMVCSTELLGLIIYEAEKLCVCLCVHLSHRHADISSVCINQNETYLKQKLSLLRPQSIIFKV